MSRGPIAPVPSEFCWGDNYVQPSGTGLNNDGYPNEVHTDTFANLNTGNGGPGRCGILARPTTNRTFSGATYYGAMDFAGNVWELGVTIGNSFGRSFAGHHGDGLLNAAGQNDVATWPTASSGPSLRGGSFSESYTYRDPTISGRRFGSYAVISRQFNIGGRGCRIAPN